MENLSPLEELTLLLLAAPSRRQPAHASIPGRTHLAKELFLLWKNPVFQARLRGVRFEPGRFGPWTEAIAVALDELSSRDLVKQTAGRAAMLSLTLRGEKAANSLWDEATLVEKAVLTDVKSNLNSLSTQELLARIYGAYPEFASASEWRVRSE